MLKYVVNDFFSHITAEALSCPRRDGNSPQHTGPEGMWILGYAVVSYTINKGLFNAKHHTWGHL